MRTTNPLAAGARLLAVLALAVAGVLWSTAGAASAADGDQAVSSWSLAPASADGPDGRPALEYVAEPGTVIEDRVLVRNIGTTALDLAVYPVDAVATEDGSFTVADREEARAGVGAWAELGTPTVHLAGGETALVPLRLSVPADAAPGDHVGGVLATLTSGGADGSSVVRENRVGVRVYLRVAGPALPSVQVRDVSARQTTSLNPLVAGRLDASFVVANTGNLRLDVARSVRVEAFFGLWSREVPLDPVDELLPRSSARGETSMAVPPLGPLTVTVTARPVASAGQELDAAAAEVSVRVWALPWPQAVVLVAAGLLIWWVRRRRREFARLRAEVAHAAAGVPVAARGDEQPAAHEGAERPVGEPASTTPEG